PRHAPRELAEQPVAERRRAPDGAVEGDLVAGARERGEEPARDDRGGDEEREEPARVEEAARLPRREAAPDRRRDGHVERVRALDEQAGAERGAERERGGRGSPRGERRRGVEREQRAGGEREVERRARAVPED